MIPQQAMRNDPLSPHTPSPLPADAPPPFRAWAPLATLRPAKFHIGVRSSKEGNQVPGGGLCPLPEDQYPPVNQARCSN